MYEKSFEVTKNDLLCIENHSDGLEMTWCA